MQLFTTLTKKWTLQEKIAPMNDQSTLIHQTHLQLPKNLEKHLKTIYFNSKILNKYLFFQLYTVCRVLKFNQKKEEQHFLIKIELSVRYQYYFRPSLQSHDWMKQLPPANTLLITFSFQILFNWLFQQNLSQSHPKLIVLTNHHAFRNQIIPTNQVQFQL